MLLRGSCQCGKVRFRVQSDTPYPFMFCYCSICRKYFNIDLSELALPGSHYTRRVIQLAVRLVVEDGVPYRPASWHLWRDHRVFVPFGTLQNWVESGGKKGSRADGRRVSGLGAVVVFGLCRSG